MKKIVSVLALSLFYCFSCSANKKAVLQPYNKPGDAVFVVVGSTSGETMENIYAPATVIDIRGNKAGIDETDVCAATNDNGFISCLSGKNFTNVGVSEVRGGTNFPAFYKNFIGSYVVSSSGMPGGNIINVYCDGPCMANE